MNLRLSPAAEDTVRREADRIGRSQHQVIRGAINRHLGLPPAQGFGSELGALVSTGTVRPPRVPYRKVAERLTLPPGVTGAGLLDRGDRT